jgi:ABC-type sugar transport system ATPase subunit
MTTPSGDTHQPARRVTPSKAVSISVSGLSHHFGKKRVLNDCTLSLAAGRFHALIGVSGSGKTTLLNCLAGLIQPTSGKLEIGSRSTGIAPRTGSASSVSLVPQTGGVYPRLSVERNLELSLRKQRLSREKLSATISETLEIMELSDLRHQSCETLSGGQRQRVALARGLVKDTPVLLLDEPLSHIDVALRQRIRARILSHWQSTGRTVLYVTHDPIEAMSLSEELIVLDQGHVVQQATPAGVYASPASLVSMKLTSVWPVQSFDCPVDLQTHSVTFLGTAIPLERIGCAVQDQGSGVSTISLAIRANDWWLVGDCELDFSVRVTIVSSKSVADIQWCRVECSGQQFDIALRTRQACSPSSEIQIGVERKNVGAWPVRVIDSMAVD